MYAVLGMAFHSNQGNRYPRFRAEAWLLFKMAAVSLKGTID
jgi:hypothetical protein